MSSNTADLMTVERLDELTVVRFHWPGIRAAADLSTVDPLWDFFDQERRQPSRVVVLIAPPEAVSPDNLRTLTSGTGGGSGRKVKQQLVRLENILRRMVEGIRKADAFVVAVVHGEVALRMAAPLLACDYRIASEETTFVHTARQVPVAPAGGLVWFLTRLVGSAKTLEMVLEGTSLSAPEARELGLVNHLTSADNVEDEALEVARRIATVPVAALRTFKRATVASCEDLSVFFVREAKLLERLSVSR